MRARPGAGRGGRSGRSGVVRVRVSREPSKDPSPVQSLRRRVELMADGVNRQLVGLGLKEASADSQDGVPYVGATVRKNVLWREQM